MLYSKEEIIKWLDLYEVKHYVINDDLTVDVKGEVVLSGRNLIELPIQFGITEGSFNCSYNNLTSLKGVPYKILGDFSCGYNELTSLQYCPKEVKGGFYCAVNQLTSIEGCPNDIPGTFYCGENKIISLKGGPIIVGDIFDCSQNQLTSLEYGPIEVGSVFNTSYNQLTSLNYCPKIVGNDFYCNNNPLEYFDFTNLKCDFKGIFYHEGSTIKQLTHLYSQGQLGVDKKTLNNFLLNIKLEKILPMTESIQQKKKI